MKGLPASGELIGTGHAPSRLVHLDVARGAAIVGALAIHALIACGLWAELPQNAFKGMMNAAFRACTPTFFLVFGMMLELVYARRLGEGKPIAGRMIQRAAQCWLGFAAGALAATLVGNLSPDRLVRALLLIGDAPWTSVLRFYAIVLIVLIPVIALRVRFGAAVPWVALACIWLLDPLLAQMQWPWGQAGQPLAFFWSSLFGYPGSWVGGSIWHNTSLIMAGMILANGMRNVARPDGPLLPWRHLLALAIPSIAIVFWTAWSHGVLALATAYAGDRMALRSAHDPAYFAIGGLSAMVVLILAAYGWIPGSGQLAAVGRRSLTIFAVGCVVINLIPRGVSHGILNGLLLLAGAILLTVLVVRCAPSPRQRPE